MTVLSPSLLSLRFTRLIHYQSVRKSLPKVPVPCLVDTLTRYLEYAKVVAEGQNKSIEGTRKAVLQYQGEGMQDQNKLEAIAERSINWVNLYWLPEMYLRVRLPLPVNSSPAYVFPPINFTSQDDMLRYTSLMVRGIMEYKDGIDNRRIERELSTGTDKHRMCMEQYDRVLGTYRQPGFGEDRHVLKEKGHKGDEHIVVMRGNQTFLIFTRIKGQLLPFSAILHQLNQVIKLSSNRPKEIVIPIAASSCGDRDVSAACWEQLLKVDENKASLNLVQKALFVVCLDDVNNENKKKNGETTNKAIEKGLIESGVHILTGGGSGHFGLNRWYDASIQLIVRSDGVSGLCIEHSAAEGIVIVKMIESSIRYVRNNWEKRMISCASSPQPSACSLSWRVSEEAQQLIQDQIKQFDELHNELDLRILIFEDFGKDSIKKWRVSPDGFVQLAMQLAHYRLHGYLVSTYESASIRRFTKGRVDNIRANTMEALEWVKAMVKGDVTKEERIRLFREAATKQAQVTVENISGHGIDNHLCALKCIAESEGKSHGMFTDPLWNEVMRFPLSTSQVTTSSDMHGSYLFYGAVVRDGYGCCYNIQPTHIILAPTAFKSNQRTDLEAFKGALSSAFREIRELLST